MTGLVGPHEQVMVAPEKSRGRVGVREKVEGLSPCCSVRCACDQWLNIMMVRFRCEKRFFDSQLGVKEIEGLVLHGREEAARQLLERVQEWHPRSSEQTRSCASEQAQASE